jgi:hypothetical protein
MAKKRKKKQTTYSKPVLYGEQNHTNKLEWKNDN